MLLIIPQRRSKRCNVCGERYVRRTLSLLVALCFLHIVLAMGIGEYVEQFGTGPQLAVVVSVIATMPLSIWLTFQARKRWLLRPRPTRLPEAKARARGRENA